MAEGKEPKKYTIKESELGEIYDSVALKMAREVAVSLNQLLRIPVKPERGKNSYRSYKKEPKDKLEGVLNYLLKQAQTKVEDREPDDHKVIKDKYKKTLDQMIIERKGLMACQKHLFDEYGVNISKSTVKGYMTKFKKTNAYIKRSREWLESVEELKLNSKRGRLGELEELYNDAYQRWKDSPNKSNADMCLKILEQARREAMPIMNQIQINNTNIQANIFTNILAKEEEVKVFERMPLHELIISKTAAKLGKDPYLLQRRLQNSYYAAQAGARGVDNIKEEIQYPTAILYNVEDLKDKWLDIQAKETEVVKEANVEGKLKEKPSDIKQALLDRVMKKKSEGKPKDDDSNEQSDGS